MIPDVLPPWLLSPGARRVALALVGLAAIWIATRVVRRSLGRWIDDPSARYRARKVVNFVALFTALVFVASVLLQRVTGLGVTLGVAGAGLAFALQEAILSVAGWLALSFGGYYRTGDRVRVGGVTGDVIYVSVLRTTLFEVRDEIGGYTGRVVRVANAAVLREPVYNYSGDFPFLWDEVTVPIRHGSDRERAREILRGAVEETVGDYVVEARRTWTALTRKYLLREAEVSPTIGMRADENWITYTIRYAVDYRRRGATRDQLWRRILDALDATDGAVQLAAASQEVTLTPASELRVRAEEEPPPAGGDV